MIRPISNRFVPVFAVVAGIELLDLATFIPAVRRVGIGDEGNPLARALYVAAGPWGAVALKAAGVSLILLVMMRVVRRYPTLAVPSAALVTAIGLFGVASNVAFGLLH